MKYRFQAARNIRVEPSDSVPEDAAILPVPTGWKIG